MRARKRDRTLRLAVLDNIDINGTLIGQGDNAGTKDKNKDRTRTTTRTATTIKAKTTS
jgi:hypothetical protein